MNQTTNARFQMSGRVFFGVILLFGIVVSSVAFWPRDDRPRIAEEPSQPDAVTSVDTHGLELLPQPNTQAGFVSSETCQECHAEEHQTWHDTYHRSMTQAATPEAVVPSFDNVTLTSRGRTYHLKRQGDEFWVDTIDPTAEVSAFMQGVDLGTVDNPPRAERRIVMTTGSHYHQTYWMQNPNGMLMQFPWVFHIDTDRWVFRNDSFLRPPDMKVTYNFWNLHCIDCHATGGAPRVSPVEHSMFSVGEMGITCEACHGPGQLHVKRYREAEDPAQVKNPAIVNPAKCTAEVSAQICGQCHVMMQHANEAQWMLTGDPYRAGGLNFEQMRQVTRDFSDIPDEDGELIATRFWPDGTARTGGREYNGLILSSCYIHGQGEEQMSCLSCHSLHSYREPDKLMSRQISGDEGCTQCHRSEQYTAQIEKHTHHAADSAGSRCVNCHMPHTSYALFHACRSHRIQSPRTRPSKRGSQPNACNLCHLDQSIDWTGQHLAAWYGTKPPKASSAKRKHLASGIRWALQGDAAQRVIAAWHMGWDESREASGDDWMVPILAHLFNDSYPAVRYVAYESLKKRDAFRDLEFDFDGSRQHRKTRKREVLAQWKASMGQPDDLDLARRTLIGRNGNLLSDVIEELLATQDQRQIRLLE